MAAPKSRDSIIKKKTIKVKFAVYTRNNGDGSSSPSFFKSVEAAEKYAENDDERNCDDVEMHTLEFDLDGNLLTPEPTRD